MGATIVNQRIWETFTQGKRQGFPLLLTYSPNAEWTLGVPGVPRLTRSVSAAFPRRAWVGVQDMSWTPRSA